MRLGLVTLLFLGLPQIVRADAASDGERLIRSGKYAQAQQLLEAATTRDPKAFAARLQLGLVYRLTGQRDAEKRVWNAFYDDYESGALDKTQARSLTYVAEAARYLGGWQDANDTFRDAVDADPKGADGARANVEWAALFLEKYDAAHAEQSLLEALQVLPKDAAAHALMARVKMTQNEPSDADREIAAALAADPKNLMALDLRAEQLVDDERWNDAIAAAKQALAVNPEDERAHTLIAAVRYIRDDKSAYEAERARVLKTNPRAWELFHGIAEFLDKQHRYDEATAMEGEALQLEPTSWVALAARGNQFLRLGDDKQGLALLRAAWKRDPFNVRTYNLLNLYDDVIAKQYVMVDGTPFRFRVSKREEKALLHYVKPLVTREYRELVARYGFTPKQPLTLELFADPEHFSVRTVGLPGIEPLGVTFGQVVTALSPARGNFNWALTLWHEVGHIFAIQMSRGRVPRWFTEGLSEYETARVDPTWVRHTNAELYRALSDGKLLSVATLNGGFSHARDVAHMVVAYHQAAEEVMFIVRRWGFDVVPRALRMFAEGKDTAQVIPAITGLDLKAYDAAFTDDLRGRLKAYDGTFFVRPSDLSDLPALQARVKAHPDDAQAKGMMALALERGHDVEHAQKLIDSVPHPQTQPRELLLAAAEVALQRKDTKMAKLLLDGLVDAAHGDGYDARFLRGKIAADAGDVATAKTEMALAKKYDPDAAQPYVVLGKLLQKSGDVDGELREWEAATRLEPMDATLPKLLTMEYAKQQRWAEVVRISAVAQQIAPYDEEVHEQRIRALVALGRKDDARAELDVALACEPTDELRARLNAAAAGQASPRAASPPPAPR